MSRIFSVQLRSEKVPENGPFLDLPAAPYELLDALEKVRMEPEESVHWEIVDYCVPSFNALIPEEAGTLYELNALAQKLSELNRPQQLAYRGLLSMEYLKGCQLIPIPRLIDFAYGTHCCQVSPDIRSDRQLGYDSVRKGTIPGIQKLSAEQIKLLDCALVGRQRREAEGSVLVSVNFSEPLGYVRQTAPIERTRLDLTLKKPDYSILLSVYGKWDPNTGRRKSTLLELPVEEDALNAVLTEYDGMGSGDDVWNRIAWDGLDCAVPRLTGMIFDFGSDNSYSESATRRLNDLAKNLAAMGPEDLTAYKALLEAVDCRNLDAAVQLLDTLGDYSLSRQASSPAGIAEERLRKAARGQSVEALISRVDMERYGEALLEENGGEITSYGLLTRKDGQPVADFKEQLEPHSEAFYLHLYCIQVLKVEPGKAPESVSMPNTLKALQAAVGGYIEAVGLDCCAVLICNEEGKLMGTPANRWLGDDIIAGTFLVVGEADGEFCSLSDVDAARYAEQFAQPMPAFGSPDQPTQREFHVL